MANKFTAGLQDILATVAPTIGLALGGPLGGVAGATLAKYLGKEKATPEEVEAAVVSMSAPEDLSRLRDAEREFIRILQENEIKLVDLENEDRAGARSREVQIRDRTPSVLAAAITVGIFLVIAFMLKFGLPSTGEQALLVMLGALSGAFSGVVNYYFGSSSSSKAKDATISAALKSR